MIIVTGTVRFGAGELERLREALARNVAAARAKDGCERYHYGVDLDEPDLLHIVEVWCDEAALDNHMATLGDTVRPILAARIEAMSIKAYEGRYLRALLGD